MADAERTILILGASRGLGLGLAEEFLHRGWRVIATERSESRALHALAAIGGRLQIEALDINDTEQANSLRAQLASTSLQILFVNAGVSDDKGPAEKATTDEFTRLMVTNALSPLRMVASFADLVASDGVIGVMSSGLGSVANNTSGGWDVYRASKAALNTLVRSYAARQRDGRAYVVIAPGWVRTDMGGPSASLDVATSMRGVAEVLITRKGAPGAAYLDYKGSTVAW